MWVDAHFALCEKGTPTKGTEMIRLETGNKLRDQTGHEYEVLSVGADKYTRTTQYPMSYVVRRDDGVEREVSGGTINAMYREGTLKVLA